MTNIISAMLQLHNSLINASPSLLSVNKRPPNKRIFQRMVIMHTSTTKTVTSLTCI